MRNPVSHTEKPLDILWLSERGLGGDAVYSQDFIFILLFIVLGLALPMATLAMIGPILRPKHPTKEKLTTYESGLDPVGDARVRYNVRYYLFALMFLAFDVETVFLYPWAVEYHNLGLYGFTEMLIFLVLLAIGLVYAWRKKVLEWK